LAVNTSTALPHLIKEKTAMSNKFEQLLDYLVNEEMDKANELFHEIVVEKSREIYENMIAEEADEDELTKEAQDDDMDESMDEPVEEETTLEIGGSDEHDPADKFTNDVVDPMAMGMDDGEESDIDGDLGGMGGGSLEDKVFDLEAEFEKLQADFAALKGDEKSEPEHSDGEADPEFGPSDDDEGGDEDGEDGDEEKENMYSERMLTREYVEKVGNDWDNKSSMRTPGPVGSGSGDKAGQTSVDGKRSVVSSASGRPTTKASAHNILQGGVGEGNNTGTSPNGKTGGLVGNVKGKFTDGGIHNVDGVKSGVKTLKGQTGWPNNNKSAGPVGSGSGDKAGQTSVTGTKSILDKAQ
jgi:hypothetical protein